MILAEAGPELGGQFRLAGLQPRRAQITDLIGWYERQLRQLQVEIRYNTYLDAEDVAAIGADHVILATGSTPPETGFQKALPHVVRLPGIERGQVWSIQDVMTRAARLGNHVVLVDEGGNWRGIGTAWHLAEKGHKVTLVTPDAMVGRELARSATDFPARATLAGLGVRFVTESALTRWSDTGAEVMSLLTGQSEIIAADSLVLATANTPETGLAQDLRERGVRAISIGDAAAPRLAAAAIHEGRKTGLTL